MFAGVAENGSVGPVECAEVDAHRLGGALPVRDEHRPVYGIRPYSSYRQTDMGSPYPYPYPYCGFRNLWRYGTGGHTAVNGMVRDTGHAAGDLSSPDLLRFLNAREQLGLAWADVAGKAPTDFACPRSTQTQMRSEHGMGGFGCVAGAEC